MSVSHWTFGTHLSGTGSLLTHGMQLSALPCLLATLWVGFPLTVPLTLFIWVHIQPLSLTTSGLSLLVGECLSFVFLFCNVLLLLQCMRVCFWRLHIISHEMANSCSLSHSTDINIVVIIKVWIPIVLLNMGQEEGGMQKKTSAAIFIKCCWLAGVPPFHCCLD